MKDTDKITLTVAQLKRLVKESYKERFFFDVGGYVVHKDGSEAVQQELEEIKKDADFLGVRIYIDDNGKIRWKHRPL